VDACGDHGGLPLQYILARCREGRGWRETGEATSGTDSGGSGRAGEAMPPLFAIVPLTLCNSCTQGV
jgi:hypothetical protein